MPDTPFAPVAEVLGWKLNDEKTLALVGFKQPDGNEFVLGISEARLREVIISLAHATEVFPAQKGFSIQAISMGTNWFEFGKDDASGDYFVRFRLVNGGHLSFVMDKSMAQQLAETMNIMVLGATIEPPPGSSRN